MNACMLRCAHQKVGTVLLVAARTDIGSLGLAAADTLRHGVANLPRMDQAPEASRDGKWEGGFQELTHAHQRVDEGLERRQVGLLCRAPANAPPTNPNLRLANNET